jgi:hypothetical protein
MKYQIQPKDPKNEPNWESGIMLMEHANDLCQGYGIR